MCSSVVFGVRSWVEREVVRRGVYCWLVRWQCFLRCNGEREQIIQLSLAL